MCVCGNRDLDLGPTKLKCKLVPDNVMVALPLNHEKNKCHVLNSLILLL